MSALTRRISSRICPGDAPTMPRVPNPPASETAAHTSAYATWPMPARKIGYSIPNRSQIGVWNCMRCLL